MKISSLILLLVAVLATSHCLTMHTAVAKYFFISNPTYLNRPTAKVAVSLSDDRIMFKACNYNTANVARDSKGTYTFSKWVANIGLCNPNNDPKIRSLFNSAKTSK